MKVGQWEDLGLGIGDGIDDSVRREETSRITLKPLCGQRSWGAVIKLQIQEERLEFRSQMGSSMWVCL